MLEPKPFHRFLHPVTVAQRAAALNSNLHGLLIRFRLRLIQ